MTKNGWIVATLLLLAASGFAQEARYVVVGEPVPVPVVANGYIQNVTRDSGGGFKVHVATALNPIGSDGAYTGQRRKVSTEVPPDFFLPNGLQTSLRGDTDAWEAATRVLEWVADRVELDNRCRGPQDAESVLRNGRGRCSGLANAAAALLLTAGYEARTVSGLLVSEEGCIPHRWVACQLPGAGWVPSDPTLGLWVVTPRHMVFAEAVTTLPEVRILEIGDSELAHLPSRNGTPLRPNRGTSLVCRLVGDLRMAGAVAVLSGSGGEVRRAFLNPEAHFNGLLPGSWQLVVTAGDTVLEHTELKLEAGRVHSLLVNVPGA